MKSECKLIRVFCFCLFTALRTCYSNEDEEKQMYEEKVFVLGVEESGGGRRKGGKGQEGKEEGQKLSLVGGGSSA